ncbi:hypothetical protein ACFC5Z_40280 [Streptomyces sp. NPDC056004]|uniref:hypothetical protein n=1 Tax=Streptomyces sp. NPDC056004 TaxID=3345677 RepID=UPI0035DBF5B8
MGNVRKSLPLEDADLDALARLRDPASPERAAMLRLMGLSVTDDTSEATLLHAVFAAGRQALRDEVNARGYAELAAQQDEEDEAFHMAMRSRGARRSGVSE